MSLAQVLILAVFGAVLIALGSAFFSLFRGNRDDTAAVKALTIRVALSIALFIVILALDQIGFISMSGCAA